MIRDYGCTMLYRLFESPSATVVITSADTWVKSYHHIAGMRATYALYDPVRAHIVCRFTTKEMVKLLCTREYLTQQSAYWFGSLRHLLFGRVSLRS